MPYSFSESRSPEFGAHVVWESDEFADALGGVHQDPDSATVTGSGDDGDVAAIVRTRHRDDGMLRHPALMLSKPEPRAIGLCEPWCHETRLRARCCPHKAIYGLLHGRGVCGLLRGLRPGIETA